MTAADSLAQLEERALHIRALRWILLVAFVLLALGGTYCAGRSHGIASVRTHTADSVRVIQKDTIRVVETRLLRDTVRVRDTRAKADSARGAFVAADSTLEATADTAASLPTSLVLPALHTCEQAIAADTVAYVAVVAELADMTEDRNVWKARAQNDEANTPKVPYFGFKSGITAGVLAVLALLHFAH